MRVLLLPQASALGPSSRFRVYQLLPLLRKLGFQSEASPAISDELYTRIYLRGESGARRKAFFLTWQTRTTDVRRVDGFDAVFVQKGVFPGLCSCFEKKIARRKPLVLDFDDAVWLPREGGSTVLRLLHRESTVQDVLCRAAAVIAGNEYLADYARRFSRNVTVIPTAIDLSLHSSVLRSPREGDVVPQRGTHVPSAVPSVIGWIGSRTTLAYLKPLRPVFQALGVVPRVIASGNPSALGFAVDFRSWQSDTEQEELSQLNIGIAPLPDTPWERGKCGVKVLQYMACGIPVVASPVGVHKEMIRHGENGFLATTTEEWIEYLRQLMADPLLGQRLGAAGRKTVEERYSLEQIAPRVAAVLKSVASH